MMQKWIIIIIMMVAYPVCGQSEPIPPLDVSGLHYLQYDHGKRMYVWLAAMDQASFQASRVFVVEEELAWTDDNDGNSDTILYVGVNDKVIAIRQPAQSQVSITWTNLQGTIYGSWVVPAGNFYLVSHWFDDDDDGILNENTPGNYWYNALDPLSDYDLDGFPNWDDCDSDGDGWHYSNDVDDLNPFMGGDPNSLPAQGVFYSGCGGDKSQHTESQLDQIVQILTDVEKNTRYNQDIELNTRYTKSTTADIYYQVLKINNMMFNSGGDDGFPGKMTRIDREISYTGQWGDVDTLKQDIINIKTDLRTEFTGMGLKDPAYFPTLYDVITAMNDNLALIEDHTATGSDGAWTQGDIANLLSYTNTTSILLGIMSPMITNIDSTLSQLQSDMVFGDSGVEPPKIFHNQIPDGRYTEVDSIIFTSRLAKDFTTDGNGQAYDPFPDVPTPSTDAPVWTFQTPGYYAGDMAFSPISFSVDWSNFTYIHDVMNIVEIALVTLYGIFLVWDETRRS